jgi:transcription-repair coupling factor (superfamily II helicase)
MQYLYPQGITPFKSGQKFYWGSLYGSAQALALIEFAKTQDNVILVVANDISHFDQLLKSLHFYNTGLDILRFDNWEVLAFDHFSPHHQFLPLFDLTKQLLFPNKNLLHRQRQPVKILTGLLVSAVDLIIS